MVAISGRHVPEPVLQKHSAGCAGLQGGCAELIAWQKRAVRASAKPVPARETLLWVGSTVPTNEEAAAFMMAVDCLSTMSMLTSGVSEDLGRWSVIIVLG